MNIYLYCPLCATKLIKRTIDNEIVLACPSCEFVYWQNPKPVVSIVLMNKGKVLMLQRANEPFKGYWVLPGGFIRWEETPEAAIRRETKEEIGIPSKIGKLIGVYQIDDDPRGMHIDIIYAGIIEGTITLSLEHSAYRFFEFTKLPNSIAYKHRQAIDDYEKTRTV